MDDTTFRELARERLGPLGADEADRAIDVTLRVLAEACSRCLADHIAEALPPGAATIMRAVIGHELGGDASAIVARTARREGVRAALGIEHLSAVASVIGEHLDDETMRLAEAELDPSVVRLLQPRRFAPPPVAHHDEHPRTTLSEGHPGSDDPLARAHHPPAHVDSVTGVAHDDERLSTAHGTRQEQQHDTLAEGRSKRT
ncbi:DUF2267 domain-containing protein [Sandaracinus amylolyticus]|uniref:DUF2267 domain-containing protein n=1 Tax=Sandaracinus amylolyticus TaxID=927083 RepID=A0A0F6VYV9_9BACT|nr:DUF2267 domain-containing protein [Sandaracinus amylolyticus]AKF03156.1 hypothetical protein DB32_000305 [Sandaracinus amylolyticus]